MLSFAKFSPTVGAMYVPNVVSVLGHSCAPMPAFSAIGQGLLARAGRLLGLRREGEVAVGQDVVGGLLGQLDGDLALELREGVVRQADVRDGDRAVVDDRDELVAHAVPPIGGRGGGGGVPARASTGRRGRSRRRRSIRTVGAKAWCGCAAGASSRRDRRRCCR